MNLNWQEEPMITQRTSLVYHHDIPLTVVYYMVIYANSVQGPILVQSRGVTTVE